MDMRFDEEVNVNGYKFTFLVDYGVAVPSTYPRNLNDRQFTKSFQIAMQMYRDWQCLIDCFRSDENFLDKHYPSIGWDNKSRDYIINYRKHLEQTYRNTKQLFDDAKCKQAHTPKKWDDDRKPGYVYLVQAITPDTHYKIGRSNNPDHRITHMGVKLPFPITPIHMIETDHMVLVEEYFHVKYSKQRLRGEWFELTEQDVADICAIEILNAEDIA